MGFPLHYLCVVCLNIRTEVRIGFQPVEYEVSEDDGVVVLNVLLLSGTLDRVLVVLFQTDPESATCKLPHSALCTLHSALCTLHYITISILYNSSLDYPLSSLFPSSSRFH